MPVGKYGASPLPRLRSLSAMSSISRRSRSCLHSLQPSSRFWTYTCVAPPTPRRSPQKYKADSIPSRSKSTMYPTSYGRLWHPGHGIVFSPSKLQDASHPRVDVIRSLHTTPATSQTAAAANTHSNYIHSEDEDGPFSTAPEFQPGSGTSSPVEVPLATADAVLTGSAAATESKEASSPMDPPITNLDYKVGLDAFREAQRAAEGSPESFWSYTLFRGPSEDGGEQKVKVHYCKSKHTMERVCQYFLEDTVLGFDLEWFPDSNKNSGPRKNVSLIQIANESRVALFHVSLFPEKDDLASPTFRKIMGDPDIFKVGVAIKGDCTRLRTHLAVDTKGIFELSHLYKLVKYSENGQFSLINKRLVPLAVQVKEHLGLPLFKGQDVRSSDWSQPLNMSQVVYSASDAYAGFQLFHVLEGKRESLDPTPPRPARAELNFPIQFSNGGLLPTRDESTEVFETEGSRTTVALSPSYSRAVRASMLDEIDGEGDSIAESIQKAPPVTPKRFVKDPRVSAADDKLASYRASIKSLRAAPSAVRSYYIWRDNEDLNPEGIAKTLREPPLQTMTVVSYILEAIKLEKLPFDKKRLRDEVLELLPKEVLQGRYKTLVQDANEPDV